MARVELGRTVPAVIGMEESALSRKRIAATPETARAIALRISTLRKARGITQGELAQRLRTSQAMVSRYEKGDVLLHAELLAQLATILRVSADELLGLRHRKATSAPAPAVDRGLARRFALIQSLPRRDRDALARTIDAFLGNRAGRHAA